MKRLFLIAFASILLINGCSKLNTTPEGPTDVRVFNWTDQTFTNVTVNTGSDDGTLDFGTVESGSYSGYIRFEKAYPDAEINLMIDGIAYSTGTPDNTYATYIGPDKISYKVYISNPELKILAVDVVVEAPIDDL